MANGAPHRTPLSDDFMPYVGLTPFTDKHAAYFFGREMESDQAIANLTSCHLTLLYGVSGVGKSSILNVGVVHALNNKARQLLARGRKPRHVAVMMNNWRDDPLQTLDHDIRAVLAALYTAPALPEAFPPEVTLQQRLHHYTDLYGVTILILLDQFEEYFLYHDNADGLDSFAEQFPQAVNDTSLRANFVIALREDGLAKLDKFKGRIPALFNNYLRIDYLTHLAGRDAIRKPLARYNQEAPHSIQEPDDALVTTILQAVRVGNLDLEETGEGRTGGELTSQPLHEQPIEVPYLQLVLERLWHADYAKGYLSLDTYNDLGGAKAIAEAHLRDLVNGAEWSDEDRKAAAAAFRYLVTASRAKVAYTLTDLAEATGVPSSRLEVVLDRLQQARILRRDTPPDDPRKQREAGAAYKPEKRYEIFHDVLAFAILRWRRDFEEEQAKAALQEEAEAEQERLKREAAMEQEHLRHEAEQEQMRLQMQAEAADIRAKAAEDQARLKAEAARDASRLRRRSLGLIGVILSILIIFLLTSTISAQRQSSELADKNANLLAASTQIAAQSTQVAEQNAAVLSQARASTYLVDATQRYDERPVLGIALLAQSLAVAQPAFLPNILEALTQTLSYGHVAHWGTTGEVLSALYGTPASPVVILAYEDSPGAVYDSQTARLLAPLSDVVTDVAISPDGSSFVVVYSETFTETLPELWRMDEGEVISATLPIRSGQTPVCIRYSPDSQYVHLARSDENSYECQNGYLYRTDTAAKVEGSLSDEVYFNPDNRLVVLNNGGDFLIYDPQAATKLATIENADTTTAPTFSTAGDFVIFASGDDALIWDMRTQQQVRRITGAGASAQFNFDGQVVVARVGSAPQVIEVQTQRAITLSSPIEGDFYTPDESAFVIVDPDDSNNYLLQPLTGGDAVPFFTLQDEIENIVFSPTGEQAVIDFYADMTLWTRTDGEIYLEDKSIDGAPQGFPPVFTPDGRFVFVIYEAGAGGALLDTTLGADAKVMGVEGAIDEAGFSADGAVLYVQVEGEMQLYSTATTTELVRLPGIQSFQFSPDSQHFVARYQDEAGASQTVLRQIDSGAEQILDATVIDGRFNRTGSFVLLQSSTPTQTLQLWDVTLGVPYAPLQNTAMSAARFDPSGDHLLLTDAAGITTLVNLTDGTTQTLDVSPEPFDYALFSAEGSYLALSYVEAQAELGDVGRVELVRTDSGILITAIFGIDLFRFERVFSSDEQYLYLPHTSVADELLRTATGAELKLPIRGGTSSFVMSPDSPTLLLVGERELNDQVSQALIVDLSQCGSTNCGGEFLFDDPDTDFETSPQGRYLFTLPSSTFQQFSLQSDSTVPLPLGTEEVEFSLNSNLALLTDSNFDDSLYDVATQQALTLSHEHTYISFRANGCLIQGTDYDDESGRYRDLTYYDTINLTPFYTVTYEARSTTTQQEEEVQQVPYVTTSTDCRYLFVSYAQENLLFDLQATNPAPQPLALEDEVVAALFVDEELILTTLAGETQIWARNDLTQPRYTLGILAMAGYDESYTTEDESRQYNTLAELNRVLIYKPDAQVAISRAADGTAYVSDLALIDQVQSIEGTARDELLALLCNTIDRWDGEGESEAALRADIQAEVGQDVTSVCASGG